MFRKICIRDILLCDVCDSGGLFNELKRFIAKYRFWTFRFICPAALQVCPYLLNRLIGIVGLTLYVGRFISARRLSYESLWMGLGPYHSPDIRRFCSVISRTCIIFILHSINISLRLNCFYSHRVTSQLTESSDKNTIIISSFSV